MKEPALAGAIVEAAKKVSNLPVTVKFRKGFDEQHCNYLSFAQTLQEAGADAVTIHGRLRSQYYAGKADWECIREVKERLRIPVIANGDVFSPEDAASLLRQTCADGIMVARGASGNPFLFGQIKQYFSENRYELPSMAQKAEAIWRQATLCRAAKGEQRAMQEFRKHMAWYLKGVKGAASLRQRALQIGTLEQLKIFVEQVFGKPAQGWENVVE